MGSQATDSEPTIEIPWTSPSLHIILATTLVAIMGITLISPVLPTIKEAFGITDAQTGLVITVFTLPSVVLAPVIGALADRYGRRFVLVPCLVIFGLSGGIVVLAPSFEWLLVFRFIQGIATSGVHALALTLIGDYYSGVQRNAVMGTNGAVLSIGTTVYPIIGGALAGLAWYAPFGVYGVGVLVGFFALFALKEPERESSALGLSYIEDAARSISWKEGVTLYGFLFITIVLLYGGALTALPFLLKQSFELSTLLIGVLVGLKSFLAAMSSTQNGRLASRFSTKAIIGVGFVCFGVGLAAIWAASSWPAVAIAMIIFGTGQGLLLPSIDTKISGLSRPEFRAGVMSLRMSVQKLGQAVGPLAFTLFAAWTDYGTVMLVAGAASVGLAAVVRIVNV